MKQEMTFALYFGNRGFFPEKLISEARRELTAVLKKLGYNSLLMDESLTQYGAIEGAGDGMKYAQFLKANEGAYDGIILCLPNFGDETGAIAALQNCGVPILVQAYPDELDKMGFADRRDAFCGKFSVMDVFYQYGLPFTTFPPHTVHPESDTFTEQLHKFAAVCRIVNGMKRMTLGAIGARTTAFKTVRFDELALQRHGITTEAFDLSEIVGRVQQLDAADARVVQRQAFLTDYADCSKVPAEEQNTMARLSIVIDELIDEYALDAIAFRCWLELEKQLKIAPCLLMSEINNRGIPAACEVDVGNAVTMTALRFASQSPATCLDWNNNYGEDPDKCILFHCGPVPQDMMTAKGTVIEHPMFAKVLGSGCGWGPNQGRIKPSSMTFASAKTENGKIHVYLGEGAITDDEIASDYFGCAGVAQISDLQRKLQAIGQAGYRHHVSLTFGHHADAVREAFTRYLGYEMEEL